MEPKYFRIVKGEDREIEVKLIDDQTKDPINLTDKVLSGVFKGCPENVELASASFEVVDAALGKIKIKLSDSETQLLKEGIQGFEVVIDEEDDRRIIQFKNMLEIKNRI